MPPLSQCRMWYHDKLDRVITALNYIWINGLNNHITGCTSQLEFMSHTPTLKLLRKDRVAVYGGFWGITHFANEVTPTWCTTSIIIIQGHTSQKYFYLFAECASGTNIRMWSWNPSSWYTRTGLLCRGDTLVAKDWLNFSGFRRPFYQRFSTKIQIW